jgi:hypothetical protein
VERKIFHEIVLFLSVPWLFLILYFIAINEKGSIILFHYNTRILATLHASNGLFSRKSEILFVVLVKHDFKASIYGFLCRTSSCLGISLASNAPVYSGLIAGLIGGLIVLTDQQNPN